MEPNTQPMMMNQMPAQGFPQQAYPAQPMPYVQANPGYPQAGMQPVVVIQGLSGQIQLQEILCDCKAPTFESNQACCGCFTCWAAGSGLWCGACCGCYGNNRPDCGTVCCAGCIMNYTAWACYGYVAGCIVGWRMMGM